MSPAAWAWVAWALAAGPDDAARRASDDPEVSPTLRPPRAYATVQVGHDPALTPDGRYAVYVDHVDGEDVTLRVAGDGEGPATRLGPSPGPPAWWAATDVAVLALDAAHHLLRLPLDGGDWQPITTLPSAPSWIEPLPDQALLIALPTEGGGLRVLRQPTQAGARADLVLEHPTADDALFDDDLRPWLLLEHAPFRHGHGVGATWVQPRHPDGTAVGPAYLVPDWVVQRAPAAHVGDTAAALGVLADRVGLGTLTPDGWAPTGTERRADAVYRSVNPATGEVDAVGVSDDRVRWSGYATTVVDLMWLEDALQANVRPLSRSADDRRWVVLAWSGDTPGATWIVDRDARTMRRVGRRYLPAGELAWASVTPLVLRARDGAWLTAYLTRPDPERFGPGPYPLVLDVHGGPWSRRFTWAFDPEAQAWADRGYATLAVNHRGGIGFGWASMASAPFGEAMFDDLIDALAHVVRTQPLDPARIAVVGSSYGGWAALRLATLPDAPVACAAAGFTRGNLVVPGGGLHVRGLPSLAWRRAHSPDRDTANLRGPVLVWSGGDDGRNADTLHRFVDRAGRRGAEVTWIRWPHDGHGLDDPDERAVMGGLVDAFLSRCLGGPAWPLDARVRAVDLQVRAGAALIPGLVEALQAP